ncbi:hypothetical protein [Bacillus sp. 1P06AnD]|uniref:hypothetical protein n=1 Tax=Bacillus sp. 1P06AnD TaxID=3132208 RepID=UPI0039A11F83
MIQKYEENITYDEAKMELFVKEDRLLHFVVKDLINKGGKRSEVLQSVFNGYILDDFDMVHEYQKYEKVSKDQ